MPVITLNDKGQIVIPAKIRKRCGLNKGTKLILQEHENILTLRAMDADYFANKAGILDTGGRLSKHLLMDRVQEREKEDHG